MDVEKNSAVREHLQFYMLGEAINRLLPASAWEMKKEAKSCISIEVSFLKWLSLSLCVCAYVCITPVFILVNSKSGFGVFYKSSGSEEYIYSLNSVMSQPSPTFEKKLVYI